MKVTKELVCLVDSFMLNAQLIQQLSHDASLSSVPLLITFIKAYGRPFLGISTPSASQRAPDDKGEPPKDMPNGNAVNGINEQDELVEKDVRDRFKRMCEGYYDNVAKILVKEHNVRPRSVTGILLTSYSAITRTRSS